MNMTVAAIRRLFAFYPDDAELDVEVSEDVGIPLGIESMKLSEDSKRIVFYVVPKQEPNFIGPIPSKYEIVIRPPSEAAGCVACDTCSGFRAAGRPCAFCAAKIKRADAVEKLAKEIGDACVTPSHTSRPIVRIALDLQKALGERA